jgi:ribosomal protein L37AE/L43A
LKGFLPPTLRLYGMESGCHFTQSLQEIFSTALFVKSVLLTERPTALIAVRLWTDGERRAKKMIDIHQTIKAEAESICPSCDHYPVCRAVDNHPCAECNQYAPVAQHGKWVSLVVKREDWKGVLHDFYQPYSCSICQNPNTFMGESAFCPHCGAKMDGAE